MKEQPESSRELSSLERYLNDILKNRLNHLMNKPLNKESVEEFNRIKKEFVKELQNATDFFDYLGVQQ